MSPGSPQLPKWGDNQSVDHPTTRGTEPSPGDVVAGYRVDSTVRRGPDGLLLMVRKGLVGDLQLMHVLDRELAEHVDFERRYERDARTIASTGHRHLLPVKELKRSDDGVVFTLYEAVEGWSVRTLVAHQGSFHPWRALVVAGQVASALDAAHARGVLHGRLTSDDVIVSPEMSGAPEHAYVAGFGLATAEVEGQGRPPEAALGRPPDERGDVYGVAFLLYECLTGATPKRGERLRGARPDLPLALEDVLHRALHESPLFRHGSATQLVREASAALYPGVDPPIPAEPAVPETPEPPHKPEHEEEDEEAPARFGRKALVGLVAAVMVLLLLLLGVATLLGGDEEEFAGSPDDFPRRRQTGIESVTGLLPGEIAGFDRASPIQWNCATGAEEQGVASYSPGPGQIVHVALCLYSDAEGAEFDFRDSIKNLRPDGLDITRGESPLLHTNGDRVGRAVLMTDRDQGASGFREAVIWTNDRVSGIIVSEHPVDKGVPLEMFRELPY